MKILVHDYAGHPFQVQLSRELARRGHAVRHVYSRSFPTPHGSLERRPGDPPGFEARGLELAEPVRKYSYLKRRRQELRYGELLRDEVGRFEPDAVLSANTPLDPQRMLLGECFRRGVRFVFWAQDLYGVGIQRLLARERPLFGRLVGWRYARLERRLMRTSDHVVFISEDFRAYAAAWGLAPARTSVIENWAPLDELPVRARDNPWARRHGLADKRCLLYAGTLGLKHDPEIFVRLARHFERDGDVRIVVVSEGDRADWLRERRLANLIVRPFQPFEAMPDVLAAADALVCILDEEAGVFSVPSKVLTYFCAARPVLLSVPAANLAARLVVENEAGVVVPPGDGPALLRAASWLLRDEGLRRRLGGHARAYAERAFDIGGIADRFEAVLSGRDMSSFARLSRATTAHRPASAHL